MTYTILVVVQVVVALALIGLILVQHGKGADAGAAFGSGASGTVFGAQGSANFMSHATAGLATVFFLLSLALAYMVGGNTAPTGTSVTEQLQQSSVVQQQVQDNTENNLSDKANGGNLAAQEQSGQSTDKDQSGDQGITAKIPD